MNIVQELKDTVLAATGYTLHYGDNSELEIKMDYAAYPCAYGVAIESSTINFDGGTIKERPTVVVAFVSLQQSEDSEQAEVLIEARKQDCFKWLAKLRKSTKVQLVSVNQAGRLYRANDAIICGFSVNITLQELVGYVECPVTPTETTV